jgi:fructosamine-3-kinase
VSGGRPRPDDDLSRAVATDLGQAVVASSVVHGGDVAAAHRMALADGRTVFAKTHASPPAGFFTTEAAGLAWLGAAGAVAVPKVLAVSDDPPARLVLGWIDTGPRTASTEADLGRALAALHRAGAPCFGREDRRTTGSLGLPNVPTDSWATFAAECRFLPLARLARDRRALPDAVVADLDLAGRLDRLGVPDGPPARLHGDLWAGNRLVGVDGRSWLIDPAAHGGHREFDLAMMRLFGGFGADCFAAYDEAWPLEPGWRDRVAVHQIAPLVVHAIKFGGAYVGAATDAIRRST